MHSNSSDTCMGTSTISGMPATAGKPATTWLHLCSDAEKTTVTSAKSKDDDCKSKTTPTGSSIAAETLAAEETLTKVLGTLATAGTLASDSRWSQQHQGYYNSKDDE
jgi:hypothetical protein